MARAERNFQDGPGSSGPRSARGRGKNAGTIQRLSGKRVPRLVEQTPSRCFGQPRRCASAIVQRHPWVCVAPRCGSKFGSTHPWRWASAFGTDCDRVPTSSQSAQASGVTSEKQMDGQLPLDQSGEDPSFGNPGSDPARKLEPIRQAGQQRPSHRRAHCIQSLRSRVSPK